MTNKKERQPLEEEADTIEKMVSLLEPLSPTARQKAVLSVIDRFGLQTDLKAQPAPAPKHKFQKTLAELKKEVNPKYATQMAAVIAYYYLVVAPEDQCKDTITVDDLRACFGQTHFKLPDRIADVLPHAAKDSAYFVAVGDGQYRLTEFGHDQVENHFPAKKRKS